ncbi:MAG: hypothetical protein HQL37_08650 [Alphaproteobacteria bacterium]|nr:hypothetical protein [Alphaproteobacteria bacterium]
MTEADHAEAWLPIKEAAKRLGLSEKALRSRIVRRTIRARRGNDGRVHVMIPHATPEHAPEIHRSMFGAEQTEARQTHQGATELVPVSVMRETVQALQASHSASLAAALQAQRDAHLATLDAVERLHQEQVEMLVERIDRAELVIERLLDERRRPWWRFW